MPEWSRIHQERRLGPWTFPLAFCSFIYGMAVQLRLTGYQAGIFRQESLSGFVVSVGNLTSGGTGKTPAVIMLARWAVDRGLRPVVLSRGYGVPLSGREVREVCDGQGRTVEIGMAGDEPSLIAREVPGVPVVISHRRYDAGLYASKRFGSQFFILDDGFQHIQLKRDLNLALMDAADPFGNGRLLPWGPLREPASQLKRADAVILTRAGRHVMASADRTGAVAWLEERFPRIPVFYADHEPDRLIFPFTRRVFTPNYLKDRRVVGFAGIACPERFKKTLLELGARVIDFKGFRDHYRFERKDVERLIHIKETVGADYLVTTEKDWMRASLVAPPYPELGCLCIRFRLLSGGEEIFRMIQDGLQK